MLKGLNPFMNVVKHNTMLTSANALEIFKDYDVIADGTDNFQTRYLVNDACVLTGKPNAYGSIFRFEGQASVFATEAGPCYRCLYPEPPPPGLVPSCAEGGVLGILPGLVGIIQATEVIKLILGIGDTLAGRLLLVDALGMNFRTLKLRKNPDCPVCGTHPTVTAADRLRPVLRHRKAQSRRPARSRPRQGRRRCSHRRWHPADHRRGSEAQTRRQGRFFVLDVREPHEVPIANLGAPLIPRRRTRTAHRRTGRAQGPGDRHPLPLRRTQPEGRTHPEECGLQTVGNLAGGILAWADKIDPVHAEVLRRQQSQRP